MKYFTMQELTRTSTGIRNVPGRQERESLILLVEKVLDPLREAYGEPIKATSGFRSPAVNRKVGGVINSHHVRGQAADITSMSDDPKENRRILELAKKIGIDPALMARPMIASLTDMISVVTYFVLATMILNI